MYNIGICLNFIGKHEEAIEWITKALAVRPNWPLYLGYRGLQYMKLNKYEEVNV